MERSEKQVSDNQRLAKTIMTDTPSAEVSGTPKHLWAVGIITLLWNSMSAYDYLMTQTQNSAYMSAFTPTQLEFFYGFPTWVVAFWALAVWGGVVGSVLLLLRSRFAVQALLVSLVSMVMTTIHNFGLSNGLEVMGGGLELAISAAIVLTAVGLFVYARAMHQRGVLR